MLAKSVSIVVPVYNEEKLVQNAIEKLLLFLEHYFHDYEIIFIESGSTDSTREILNHHQNNKHIKIINEGRRNGFGAALRLGYASATMDLVCLVTVDFPFDLKYIHQGASIIDNYDCVLSYRSQDKRPFFRLVQSWVFNKLIKLILGLKASQINSAFKLFKKEVIQSLPLKENGWLIDAEIILNLQRMGYKWKEIPVPLVDLEGRKSSVSPFSFIFVLRDLFRLLGRG